MDELRLLLDELDNDLLEFWLELLTDEDSDEAEDDKLILKLL